MLKELYSYIPLGFIPLRAGSFNMWNNQNSMSHQQKDGGKNHMMISIGAEIAYDKTQHFIIKTFNKIEIEGNYFHIIKAIYEKSKANHTQCLWKAEYF